MRLRLRPTRRVLYPPLEGEARTAEGSPGWGGGGAPRHPGRICGTAVTPTRPADAGRPPPSRGRGKVGTFRFASVPNAISGDIHALALEYAQRCFGAQEAHPPPPGGR